MRRMALPGGKWASLILRTISTLPEACHETRLVLTFSLLSACAGLKSDQASYRTGSFSQERKALHQQAREASDGAAPSNSPERSYQ